MFCAELDAVMMELSQEEPEVVHTGSTAAMEVGDDIGLREGVVDSLASIAEALGEGENAAPVSDSALDKKDPAVTIETQLVEGKTITKVLDGGENAERVSDSALDKEDPASTSERQSVERKTKYPRVEPPDLEDQPGQAIREDTPGYIAKAFPKLFPHGTGDYHGDHCGLRRTLRFEEWGRYIMLWHDGRFMKHTRFRYWLLDTMLRVMIPGVQRTFFRTRQAAQDYSLESLMDSKVRHELVQHMSSVSNVIPGTVGERREMRQELEAMVHQVMKCGGP